MFSGLSIRSTNGYHNQESNSKFQYFWISYGYIFKIRICLRMLLTIPLNPWICLGITLCLTWFLGGILSKDALWGLLRLVSRLGRLWRLRLFGLIEAILSAAKVLLRCLDCWMDSLSDYCTLLRLLCFLSNLSNYFSLYLYCSF